MSNLKNVNAKNFNWTLSKKFYFFNFKFIKAKTSFKHNSIIVQLCTIVFRADWKIDNIRKIVNFTYTLKIYTNDKPPVFRTTFLELTFWKLLRNSYCTKQLLTLKI